MYPSSNAYKTAIHQASRPYDTVEGTVTFEASTGLNPLTVDSSNMPTNAITISSQCIDGEEIMFGGVFSNELKLSIITDLDRYCFYNAVIELYYKIVIGTDSGGDPIFETIPLGVFKVADADRPSNQVNVTAYDNMTLLDLPLGGQFVDGTPWQVFQQVQQQTGMLLGFDEEDLEGYVNYTYQLSASSDRGLQTYRDVVKEVCQQLGCFAYADRTGKLNLKEFSTRPDISLNMSNWYSVVPADYTCTYIGLSITSLKGTYTKAVESSLAQGLTMVIEDAPAWDYGLETVLQAKTDNLFNHLRNIDEYTPCDLDMPSDATYECGDRLELTLRNGDVIETLITSMEWKFHQGMSITSEGLNPYLEGGSALDNATSRIISQTVAKSKLQFVSFTNANEVVIADGEEKKIGDCVFNPSADTQAMFVATILCDIDDTDGITVLDINNVQQSISGDCEVTVFYKMGVGSEKQLVPSDAEPYYAIEELDDGRHIITVTYPLNSLVENTRYEFEIWLSSNGGTITIPQRSLEATIFGQEIADITRFDGVIRVEEEYPLVGIGYVEDGEFADTVLAQIHEGIPSAISENVGLLSVGGAPETDYILDQNGDNILDQENEPIIGAEDIVSPAIGVPDFTENVNITLELDDSLYMRLQGADSQGKYSFYLGDELDTGFYNTLYNDSEEEE